MSRKLVDGQKPTIPPGANKGGRPRGPAHPMTSEETMTRIEQFLRMGLPLDTACAACGVRYELLRQWVITAQEHPTSQYGALMNRFMKAIAEFQVRDVAIIDAHAHGRDAKYEMEVAKDKDGNVLRDQQNNVIMQVAKDGNGNPIIKSLPIKSDWRAALEMLGRRIPKTWARRDQLSVMVEADPVLTIEATPVENKEVISKEQKERKLQEYLQLAEQIKAKRARESK